MQSIIGVYTTEKNYSYGIKCKQMTFSKKTRSFQTIEIVSHVDRKSK